jgi:hypothetical protein
MRKLNFFFYPNLSYPGHVLADDRLAGGAVSAQAGIEVGPDVLWRLVGARRVFVAVRLVPVGQIFMVPVPPLAVSFGSSIPERPEVFSIGGTGAVR